MDIKKAAARTDIRCFLFKDWLLLFLREVKMAFFSKILDFNDNRIQLILSCRNQFGKFFFRCFYFFPKFFVTPRVLIPLFSEKLGEKIEAAKEEFTKLVTT